MEPKFKHKIEKRNEMKWLKSNNSQTKEMQSKKSSDFNIPQKYKE